MRSVFRGYIRPTRDALARLWDEATFSFDANVLLNLYRLSKPSSDALLAAMGKLGGRVWLTHQAGIEFLRQYRDEARSQAGVYDEMIDHLTRIRDPFGHPRRSRPLDTAGNFLILQRFLACVRVQICHRTPLAEY